MVLVENKSVILNKKDLISCFLFLFEFQEEIRDLLSRDSKICLELRERPDIGVYVKDLSSFVTKSVEEIEHVMSIGHANRTVGFI